MEKQTFKARWSFILVLIIVIAGICIADSLYSFYWLFHEDLGSIAPTRYYADQVGKALMFDINKKIRMPSEIYRWRYLGGWDGEPEFTEATLFWFTYNACTREFNIRQISDNKTLPVSRLERIKSRLESRIDSLLYLKLVTNMTYHLEIDTSNYKVSGLMYPDEPKVLGLVTDMDKFQQVVLPQVLLDAQSSYPGLKLFTDDLRKGDPAQSSMFIIYRNDQDSIIAQIGLSGDYSLRRETGSNDYVNLFPHLRLINIQQEPIIPDCFDVRWERALKLGYYGLIVIFLIVLFLWIKAEIKLGRLQK